MRRRLRAAGALGVVAAATGAALLLAATPAQAEVDGPCTATVNGANVNKLPVSDPKYAIKVKHDASISYNVTSPVGVTGREFVLSFAGADLVLDRGSGDGGTDGEGRGGTAAIKEYAWMGVGLYQVAGVAHLSNGTTCSGAVLIDVEGNPLTTAAGVVGLILTAGGSLGAIINTIRTARGGHVTPAEAIRIVEQSGILTEDEPEPATTTTATTTTATPAGGTEPDGPGPDAETKPPKKKPQVITLPPDVVNVTTAATTAATGSPNGATAATAAGAAAGGAAPAGDPPEVAVPGQRREPGAVTDGTPPELPGMGIVKGAGTAADSLTEAHGQLTNAIDGLPISDEQKEKLTEKLGLETIKEKLDTVKEVSETIQHFENVGTETVDEFNRYGINGNAINALVWMRWTTEAAGRVTQKFTDGLVTPVLEPVAKAVKESGVDDKADAGEWAKTLIPVQATAEEASKAMVTASKNVLGGDNILGQIGQNAENDEEWRAIRTFQ